MYFCNKNKLNFCILSKWSNVDYDKGRFALVKEVPKVTFHWEALVSQGYFGLFTIKCILHQNLDYI